MWQAVITNDRNFDRIFYYGVVTTGIFCLPSCKSKLPKLQNVRFFTDKNQAIAEGYHACKRCRPDFSRTSHEPMAEIIMRIKNILEKEYFDPELLAILPARVGVSASHLQGSFKKHTGFTPKRYLQNLRIEKAKELLVSSESDNTTIGFTVGFQSLSSFYAEFRRATGISPRAYRIKNCRISGGGNDGIGL